MGAERPLLQTTFAAMGQPNICAWEISMKQSFDLHDKSMQLCQTLLSQCRIGPVPSSLVLTHLRHALATGSYCRA